jgi:predicted ATPase
LIVLSAEQGFPYFLKQGTYHQGCVWVEEGQREQGIAQMYESVASLKALGANLGLSHNLVWLAEAYGKNEQVEEGLATLTEALPLVSKNGERQFEAELYRVKGELLRQRAKCKGQKADMESEVEICFRQAIDIARRQGAKSLELRTATSLARLWQQQGKYQAAYDLLAPIDAWFTEGFETADLQDAKALLEELAG